MQKAIANAKEVPQFIKLMELNNQKLEAALICRALCGKYAVSGLADYLNFARKFNQFILAYTKVDSGLRPELTKLLLLARVSDITKLGTPAGVRITAARITELLVISKFRRILSGANLFDNIWWFNKEITDDSLNMIELLMFMNAKTKDEANIFKLFKNLRAIKLKATYKCELFAQAFAPQEKKKKTASTKKIKGN